MGMLAEKACLAAHNLLRFKHGVSFLNRYRLGSGTIRDNARAHAKWLLDNNKFQHSSQTTYGENLCRITWKSPAEYTRELGISKQQSLAIGSIAVEEWYKEYLNYSQKTSDWNGNIFHDEQISHFLQVIWDGKKSDNKI